MPTSMIVHCWLCLCALPAVRNVLGGRDGGAAASPLRAQGPRSAHPGRRHGLVHGHHPELWRWRSYGAAWKQPEATHIVRYQRKDTHTKELEGRVACKLAVDNYGRSEWWLLLEPEPK